MKLGAGLEAVRGLDRFPGDRLGERYAGQHGLAIDQHRAGAAAALAAAELGRMIPDFVAQSRKEAHASIDEDRDLAAVVSKL